MSADRISTAIDALDPQRNSFLVLEESDQRYMQAAFEGAGLVVERRDGNKERHFRAWRMGGDEHFPKDEVKRIFLAYFQHTPSEPIIEWRRHKLGLGRISPPTDFSWKKATVLAVCVGAAVAFKYLLSELLR